MSTAQPNAKTVLVLGGAGFVGRHAVEALIRRGHRVVVGTRRASGSDPTLDTLTAAIERRALRHERLLKPADWHAALTGVDAVINCVGILRPRLRETYERVHHLAPTALADACHARGLRLIQTITPRRRTMRHSCWDANPPT